MRPRAEGEPVIEFRDIGKDFPSLLPEFIMGQGVFRIMPSFFLRRERRLGRPTSGFYGGLIVML